MKSLNTNVRDADSNITKHQFPWKWRLSDLNDVEKNGKKVFSCFSCGGGSTMGYKLAGYTVVGNCEIDEDMEKIYKQNHHPKHTYLMDIRDFNRLGTYPDELKNLDILDGSPPCSVFSDAGAREKGWGTEKTFREGQKKQRLDDLFLHFIRTAEILKPKIIIAENVKGLVTGNAKGYVNEIIKAFKSAGYSVQIFLLDAQTMGVPQRRKRVFFIARRNDLNLPKLVLDFKEKPIHFGEVRSAHGIPLKDCMMASLIKKRRPGDKCFSDISERVRGKRSMFNDRIVEDHVIAPTNTSGGMSVRFVDGEKYSDADYIATQTFPQDYDFGKESVQYVCGMSVPPVMMAQIASAVYEQWLKDGVCDEEAEKI